MGANTLDIRVRPGSVEGPRVLPIQPVTLLLGKESSLVRTDDASARMFCFGRLVALTRPEIIVARLYSGHLLNDVVCGLIDMLGFETRMVLSKRALAWSEHFANLVNPDSTICAGMLKLFAPQLGLHTFEEYSQRVEEFSLAMGLTVCGDLRGAERGLAWVGDPVSSLSTDALRCRLHAFALGDSYSDLRRRLWGGP